MKTCYFCKGNIEKTKIDYMAHHDETYTLITELPVQRCKQCGEVYMDLDAAEAVDNAVARSKTSAQKMVVPVVPAFELARTG